MRENFVEIDRAVTRPGSYDLGQSLKLSELIGKADGLLGDAHMDRADIIRIKPDFTEELIKININKIYEDSLVYDPFLQALDRVTIYSESEMIQRNNVSIFGHIKNPGRYLLFGQYVFIRFSF